MLKEVIMEEWRQISPEVTQKLVKSMPRLSSIDLSDDLESRDDTDTQSCIQIIELPALNVEQPNAEIHSESRVATDTQSCVKIIELPALNIEQPNVDKNAEDPMEVPRENASNIDISSANLYSFQTENFMTNFMGHHKDIHKGVYRVPASITEITEVSKMLMAALNNDKESEDEPDPNTVDKDSSDDENALNDHITKQKRVRKSQKRQRIESTDESDFGIDEKNMSAKKRRSRSPFGKTKRMRWSQEERAEITSVLGDVKLLDALPSLQTCNEIIRSSKCLQNRTPAQLKTWIDNQRKAESRKRSI
ncbi:hypothetical protein ACLKA6_019114 [Drosophila palustris]